MRILIAFLMRYPLLPYDARKKNIVRQNFIQLFQKLDEEISKNTEVAKIVRLLPSFLINSAVSTDAISSRHNLLRHVSSSRRD